ncbi:hypothetical protein Scep_021905 [Stephania cephalantha]|uniref:Uncharacterized protein n=1 Tax=Stephania cephalantha TaxID=152367 RepID=A0AAP0I1S0_9MAGN
MAIFKPTTIVDVISLAKLFDEKLATARSSVSSGMSVWPHQKPQLAQLSTLPTLPEQGVVVFGAEESHALCKPWTYHCMSTRDKDESSWVISLMWASGLPQVQ